jgi:Domain of unknown function (DUF4136)
MLNTRLRLSVVGALLFFGCASQISTTTTYDESVDFTSYRTFGQGEPPAFAEGMPGYSEITGRKIQQRIAHDLEQKGLQPASWDEADLQVTFTLGGQARQQTEYRGGAGWGWYGAGDVTTENYIEGSLVIDIGDRVKNRLIWHGYGSKDIFSQSGDEETVLRAVDALLAKYPPAEGEKAK